MFFLTLLTLLGCPAPDGQARTLEERLGTPSESAVVWRGFEHTWGYNHRMNSFGDHVAPLACEDAACAVEVKHSAASGSGSDVAQWSSRHTRVHAPGVTFQSGTTRLAIDVANAEGKLLTMSTDVVVDGADLTRGGRVDALLNGFDLAAQADADKLEHLTLSVGAAEVVGDSVRFPIDLALQLDCDSLECDLPELDNDVHYEVLVSWLLVGGESGAHTARADSVDLAYRWGNAGLEDELSLHEPRVVGVLDGEPGLPTGFVGLTGLSVDLDHQHHMAEWATAIDDSYDAETGQATFDANLAFKQWNKGTWWNPLSYTSPGSAAFEADVLLVQLREGCVATGDVSGEISWSATGGPASEAAVASRIVEVPGCE